MSDYSPETGPDGRQRPRFGEYATPEEQRSRIQQPDVTEALSSGIAPEPVAETAIPSGPQAPAAVRPPSPVNRIVTIVLLAIGAANVLLSSFSYLDLPSSIERAMQVVGFEGELSDVQTAQTWGIIATVVLVGGYLLTAVLAWRVMSSGRISWWIPLVGAIVTYLATSLCIGVVLMNDPAFIDYLTSVGGAG